MKGSVWIAALLLVAQLSAQEKTPAFSQKSQDAGQNALRPAGAIGNNPMALADSVAANPKESAGIKEVTKALPGNPESSEGKSEPAGGIRVPSLVKRDPFRPITLNLRSTVRRRENLSPLEQFGISQLNLVGIIRSAKEMVALVEDNVGRGYTVRVGTPIGANDGKVKMITPVAVLIEEEYIDLYGAKKRHEVSMRLPLEKLE